MTEERANELEEILCEKINLFENDETIKRNLDDETWKCVVEAANSGDPVLRADANMLAVMGVERYAASLMKSMGCNPFDDDFAQATKMGIIAALPKFNPEKGKATTYFKPFIQSEIMDEYKNRGARAVRNPAQPEEKNLC